MNSDRKLQDQVLEELKWEPSIDESKIAISVREGVATMTGQVASYGERYRAEKAALRVRGVAGVANDLVVKLTPPFGRTDTQVAEAVVTSLSLMPSVPKDRIKAVVRDGMLTLEGEVEWDFQRSAAMRAVRDLAGVKGVTNLITVKPRVVASDLGRKITAAFHRNAQIDADHVKVEVAGSHVTLSGHVSSWGEKRQAERTAWSAPGVSRVTNLIAVASGVAAY